MHHTQHFLHGKKPVSNHTQEKRRNDGAGSTRHVGEINNIRHTVSFHKVPTRGVPGTPDKELQKHHDAEAALCKSKHDWSDGLKTKPSRPAEPAVSCIVMKCAWPGQPLRFLPAGDFCTPASNILK